MKKHCTISILLIFFINLSVTWSACIFLDDCPVAVKYMNKRKHEPETRTIFQKAHCGVSLRNGIKAAVIDCDKIPDFDILPQGCVPFDQCEVAKELRRTRRNELAAINLLRSSACGQNIRSDLILCDNVARKVAVKNKTVLLPEECGIQAPSNKIINGERAEFEDYPWIALLQYKNRANRITFNCHGTLINNRYVVTAAHCLSYSSAQRQTRGSLYKIILGEYDITTTEDCLPRAYGGYCTDTPQEFSPESIHIHPDFDTDPISDIALVRLDKNAYYSEFVKPICLPPDNINVRLYDTLLIAGWGKTETRKMSPVKLKTKIELLPNEDCSKLLRDSSIQLCAGSRTSRSDACQGDSGGPLMKYQKYPNGELRNVLLGIVSYGGASCGSGGAIYTNVPTFYDWILETMHD